MAFLTTLTDSPAEMSATVAPSFCDCLTAEFMKTVQREPRLTGARLFSPSRAKFSTL